MSIRYKKSNEIKQLEKLQIEYTKNKYPNMPEHTIPKTMFRDDNTNGLTKSIVAYCKIKNIFVERVSNTGRNLNGKWIKGTGRNGTADLHAIHNSRPLKIEVKCKATKDKQSQVQKKYQQEVERAGGIYIIIRDFADFYNYINQFS